MSVASVQDTKADHSPSPTPVAARIGKLASGSTVRAALQPALRQRRRLPRERDAGPRVESIDHLVLFLIAHAHEGQAPGGEEGLEMAMRDVALQEADRLAGEIGVALERRARPRHQGRALDEGERAGQDPVREFVIDDFRAAEEEQVVAPGAYGVVARLGVVERHRHLDRSSGRRDAEGAAQLDQQAARRTVFVQREQAGPGGRAAMDGAARLDPIQHRAGDRGRREGARRERRRGERAAQERRRPAGQHRFSQLYAGNVAGSVLKLSGGGAEIPWRRSSGVTPIALHPWPP
jgi:hypothetical protein